MSATRLLVLGVVRMHGSAHGYQVRRELLSWSADKWANVQPGSIYHALKKMTTEQLLEQVATEAGSGPDRTAYRLTEDGEAEFQLLLARALSQPDPASQERSAAIVLMTALPRERVLGLLRHQLVQLEAEHRTAGMLADERTAGEKPAHVHELFRLWQLHADANVTWLRELVARLEAGEYLMADDSGQSFGEPPARRPTTARGRGASRHCAD
ncbi:PadR family transcriptional regulator [Amycolatopsis acidiphila]|uniref:PadR family transcriptional regulator n=1 Tax=Amycolatopsis acidiphila TaxID=715473 RepID=A0A558A0A4_9PSEU|nr:PadR family transcriptional regulator [Amycolatopsis acidiphila]TVT17695.1 PadR family transcriptional regulator [Amycolatopsis acidiphila]UIJ59065.1 PadR family transcriptional regulator [Amycolatopsis acidiphila]GHG95984.1 PadR family transcriptional regulator [Amycolatopsis acidiphila]